MAAITAIELQSLLSQRIKDPNQLILVVTKLDHIFGSPLTESIKNPIYAKYLEHIANIQKEYGTTNLGEFDELVKSNKKVRDKYLNLMVNLGMDLAGIKTR